jgi:DNA-binding HxlR family transcriptional regulator
MTNHISREILPAFWKVHVLQHAQEGPIYGNWIFEQLRRHGFRVSPGTLYPLLGRMEREGWLRTVENTEKKRIVEGATQLCTHIHRRQVSDMYSHPQAPGF